MYGLPDFSFAPNQIVNVHPDLAAAWIASGLATANLGSSYSGVPKRYPLARESDGMTFTSPVVVSGDGQICRNGIIQDPDGDYTYSGNSVVFPAPLALSDKIVLYQ